VQAHGYLFREKTIDEVEDSDEEETANTSDEEEEIMGSQTITYFEGNGTGAVLEPLLPIHPSTFPSLVTVPMVFPLHPPQG
jgi:hypothetical protein